jgi:hypothetical protein
MLERYRFGLGHFLAGFEQRQTRLGPLSIVLEIDQLYLLGLLVNVFMSAKLAWTKCAHSQSSASENNAPALRPKDMAVEASASVQELTAKCELHGI